MQSTVKHNISHLLLVLWKSIHAKRRRQILLFIGVAIVASFAEIISLGAVIPLIGVLTSPEYVSKIPLIRSLAELFGVSDYQRLIKVVIALFIVASIFSGVIRLFALWLGNRIAFAIGSDISRDIYEKILYQPYVEQIRRNSSDSIASITTHVNTVVSYILQPFTLLIISVVVTFGILITLIVVNPFVAFWSAIFFGCSYMLVMFATRGLLKKNSIIVASSQAKIFKALQEGLGAIRDVLINNYQKVYCDLYEKADHPMRKAQSTNLFIAGSPRFIMETIGLVLLAMIAYYFSGIKNNSESLILLGTIAFGAQRLLPVLQQAFSAWAGIRGSTGSLVDVITMLKIPRSASYNDGGEIHPLRFNKAITFENVVFEYSPSNGQILKGVSFVINKGERVGIVGDTGSGKSTMLDILMGLLRPVSGRVIIDNNELSEQNIRQWQKNISQVPQSVFLTDATIAENIAFGISLNEINMQRVKLAASRAHVSDFVDSKANGYLEKVGERGIALSGGQKQRIAIARALYKEAGVLIFDEATSALDNKTEKAVINEIESLGREITIIMIAHRLSTIERCDKIIELQNGTISSIGSYDELLKRSESFRRLVNAGKQGNVVKAAFESIQIKE